MTSLEHDYSSMPFFIQEIRYCILVLILENLYTIFLPTSVNGSKNLVISMDYLQHLLQLVQLLLVFSWSSRDYISHGSGLWLVGKEDFRVVWCVNKKVKSSTRIKASWSCLWKTSNFLWDHNKLTRAIHSKTNIFCNKLVLQYLVSLNIYE